MNCPNCNMEHCLPKGKLCDTLDCGKCGFPMPVKTNRLQPLYLVRLDSGKEVFFGEDCLQLDEG